MTSVIFLFVLLIVENYIKRLYKGSLNIIVHLSMKIILVDPNLIHTFFGNNFLILIMRILENNYFLVCTKIGCLWYPEFSLDFSIVISSFH